MMTIERAKYMIHQLANQLTVIMGNLDLAINDIPQSPVLIEKARKASREALVGLRQLSHLLASIAEEAHTAAARAADEAQRAALAAGIAVEQAETLKNAADELQRRTTEIKNELEKPFVPPGSMPKKK